MTDVVYRVYSTDRGNYSYLDTDSPVDVYLFMKYMVLVRGLKYLSNGLPDNETMRVGVYNMESGKKITTLTLKQVLDRELMFGKVNLSEERLNFECGLRYGSSDHVKALFMLGWCCSTLLQGTFMDKKVTRETIDEKMTRVASVGNYQLSKALLGRSSYEQFCKKNNLECNLEDF